MASNANLQRLHVAGVSIWLDTLSRERSAVMIKVPATEAGLPAIEELTRHEAKLSALAPVASASRR